MGWLVVVLAHSSASRIPAGNWNVLAMQLELELDFISGEGNLLRILGVLERRGWSIDELRLTTRPLDSTPMLQLGARLLLRCSSVAGNEALLHHQLSRILSVTCSRTVESSVVAAS